MCFVVRSCVLCLLRHASGTLSNGRGALMCFVFVICCVLCVCVVQASDHACCARVSCGKVAAVGATLRVGARALAWMGGTDANSGTCISARFDILKCNCRDQFVFAFIKLSALVGR